MRKAFSTAELLVTLTIIGVIAILVLPGFVQDYHKKVYTARLKKNYETVITAINQACMDSNVSSFYMTSYYSDLPSFANKYLKMAGDKKAASDEAFAEKYKSISSDTGNTFTISNNGMVVNLSDGSGLYMTAGNRRLKVYIDVNGKAEPNRGGRDMFTFYVNAETNSIVNNTDESTSVSTKCLKTSYEGAGCIYQLINDGWVMNY